MSANLKVNAHSLQTSHRCQATQPIISRGGVYSCFHRHEQIFTMIYAPKISRLNKCSKFTAAKKVIILQKFPWVVLLSLVEPVKERLFCLYWISPCREMSWEAALYVLVPGVRVAEICC